MKSNVVLCLVIACITFVFSSNVQANNRTRDFTDTDIAEGWRLLDCGQQFREVWFNEREQKGVGKTYSELLASLNSFPVGGGCIDTHIVNGSSVRMMHQDFLIAAANKFNNLLKTKTGDALEQAQWGLQESFSLMSEARLIKGNDLMINGLRSRFKAEPDSKSQIELLGDRVTELK